MRSTLRCCKAIEKMRGARLIPLEERRNGKDTASGGIVNVGY
jgi:hypothetical protein